MMRKVFHKIHLWLSVPFGVFITLVCFSGAMLVFEKEVMEASNPQLYYVKNVGDEMLPLDELAKKANARQCTSDGYDSFFRPKAYLSGKPVSASPILDVYRPLYWRSDREIPTSSIFHDNVQDAPLDDGSCSCRRRKPRLGKTDCRH